MARRRSVASTGADIEAEAVGWYRDELSKPAPPPSRWTWPPTYLGPTWQRTPEGHWLLPELTLGWAALGWSARTLQLRPGVPWRYTLEQARWLLWWMSIDDRGAFLYRDGVLQRLKGWGKDPLGACLCAIEAFGPCRFAGWDNDRPVATDCPDAWVQTAAVALSQTRNTMRLFPSLFTDEAKAEYRIQIGKETIYGLGDTRLISAVTSSPATLEGNRGSFVLLNETQHWKESNRGIEMAEVLERNAVKSPDGAARSLRITNAPEPGGDSVAQRDRDAYEEMVAGDSLTTGLMYDSIEAAPDAPLSAEAAPEVVESIRGDSVWLNTDRIVASILDTRNPPSQSRRWWYNQLVAAEDAWVSPQEWDARGAPELEVSPTDEIVVFFDGSKSDDATGIAGCRVSDGHVITLGMWQRPPKNRPGHAEWLAPREAIDQRMIEVFDTHNVVAFWADPSHAREDETLERYWDDLIDIWHRRWRDDLQLWAQPGKHSVMWDMTSSTRTEEFTAAVERTLDDIQDGAFTHDGDGRMRIHVTNARRAPNRFGVSIAKASRHSKKKIDLAVCMVGSRMVRRLVLNARPKKKRTGQVWL